MKKHHIQQLRIMTLTFLIFIIAACSRNPVTGKKELSLMSESQEIALGKQSDPGIVAAFGLYPDEDLQKFINTKGQEMARISHRAHLNYEFKVLDSPVVNAFAVPGGYVYFTRGILAHFNNEAEFAGVLGHEIGHITARHSAKQQTGQILGQLGLLAGVVASKEFRKYANVASQSLGLLFLKNSRDHESQSDKLGVEYSTKIGYDAKHMANFFNTLHQLSGGGDGRIPTFLSTHPDPLDRNQKVEKMASEWQAKDPRATYAVNRNSYLKLIDGIIYGEDPRQGYVENDVFYHPEMKFQYPIPRGWKTVNSPQQVQMAPSDGKALMIFTLSPDKTLGEAANNFVVKNQLQEVESSNLTVNGYPARGVVADQINEQDPTASLRIVTYFIQDGNLIYMFHGMSKKTDFSRYQSTFRNSMEGFRKLTDQSKINVSPDRIHIKSVTSSGTLQNALRAFRMPADKMKELALINGMSLTDQVKRGQLIKVVGK